MIEAGYWAMVKPLDLNIVLAKALDVAGSFSTATRHPPPGALQPPPAWTTVIFVLSQGAL
jgi:hypothetical protein